MASDGMVPKSRITLTYNTRQPDQLPKEKELPFRLLILGDLSGRKWKPEPDPKTTPANSTVPDDFEHRPIYNLNGRNLDAVISKMNVSVTLKDVSNRVEPGGSSFDVTIPVRSLQSFEPGEVVKLVKPVERLLELRRLILDLQQNVDNKKEFRALVRKLSTDKTLREELKKVFEQHAKGQLAVPPPAAASGN